ncbi:lipopolysaccharide assembly protein LapA domain-containing protein [Nocardiopsis potens]|uniref:lipopolysaccharide assembly protein LapA domain-containing protein n=1 Tax=Nocardiopsis potens TaxID=1246458 RepID=UPI00034DB6E1|nr:lipopolysaccharide assembly protein LapA domain-containing protein [Nocardiopsis potens]
MADGTAHEKKTAPGRSIPPRAWVALALLAVVVVFVLQNRDPTQIQVLLISVAAPLWATLAAAVAAGMVIGWLLRPSARRKQAKR